uniref:Putative structural maintenance of chromosomes protein 5 n=1 Tax=Nosema pernyi TaxID=1112939 RepID=X5EM12_9MICR|nr:putative structural maintenance of chromosomes protein 5 [Nosema pernyi]
MEIFKDIKSEFKTLDFLENNYELINKNLKEIKNQIEKNNEVKNNLKKVMNEKKNKISEIMVKKGKGDGKGGETMVKKGKVGDNDGCMDYGKDDMDNGKGDLRLDDDNDGCMDNNDDVDNEDFTVRGNNDQVNDDKMVNSDKMINNNDDGTLLNTQMKLLPNTIEDLNSEIIKEKTQLKFINVSDEAKIEYENKKNQLDKILNELENTTNTKKSYEDKINEIKGILIKELILLTEKIDKEFQNLFNQMGCEGKIEFVYKNLNLNSSKGSGYDEDEGNGKDNGKGNGNHDVGNDNKNGNKNGNEYTKHNHNPYKSLNPNQPCNTNQPLNPNQPPKPNNHNINPNHNSNNTLPCKN